MRCQWVIIKACGVKGGEIGRDRRRPSQLHAVLSQESRQHQLLEAVLQQHCVLLTHDRTPASNAV